MELTDGFAWFCIFKGMRKERRTTGEFNYLFAAFILLAGCVDTEPIETQYVDTPPPLTEQEYELQLVNLLILQQDLTDEVSQEQMDSARTAFFEEQGWSWGAFDSTHKYHESYPSRQVERMERLSTEVRALMDSISTQSRSRRNDPSR